MSDATERIVNLALYLAAAGEPVSAERVRADVSGYPSEQDEAAFLRMFERDKDELRVAGFVIDSDSQGNYLLDAACTFSAEISLTPEEYAALRAASAALLDDPAFPFAGDLRFALAKVAGEIDAPEAHASASIADEHPAAQGGAVATIAEALGRAKKVTFLYTNSRGQHAQREAEPYGLFAREGRWYMVGRDIDRDEVRTFALARLSDLSVNAAKPKSPDFERPADFDVSAYIRLPFQFGAESFTATLQVDGDSAWRVPALVAGEGETERLDSGEIMWSVRAADRAALLKWIIEMGPGIHPVEPHDLASEMISSLEKVAAAHE